MSLYDSFSSSTAKSVGSFSSTELPITKAKPAKNSRLNVKKLTPSALKEIELKNHARKLAGLDPIKVVVRKCMSCGKLFESSGNRSCGCQIKKSGFIAGREII